MKLPAREVARYVARPDPNAAGALIYGADAMRVALRRQELLAALLGPQADEEMRLARIQGAELRRDPAMLLDAVKAQGFFPGPRAAFVEDANDGLAETVASALAEWRAGDAQILVTAGSLKAASKLRKLFEAHPTARAIALYDDPPGRDEIEGLLRGAGLSDVGRDAMTDLTALARELGPGDFRQTLDKIALYKTGDPTPLTPDEIAALAPASTEAALDDMLSVVAEARVTEIGPLMQRLSAQGVAPTGLCIGALRHFRQLYAAASDPGGPGSGIARLRPPVYGPRRDRMVRQAQAWGAAKLEQGLGLLIETDLTLRSTQKVPQMAVVERALIRLAMLAR